MPLGYPAGSCEFDAWTAGAEEGHQIWRTASATPAEAVTPAEIALLKAWRAMDDRSQRFLGRLSAAQAQDCPRRVLPRLRLVVAGKAQVGK
jgi:hypothetical protein